MKLDVKIDSNCKETEVSIRASAINEEVTKIIAALNFETQTDIIAGIKDGAAEIIAPQDIIRIYAQKNRVTAVTKKGEYVLKSRLYELEEKLKGYGFVRISNSEIICLKTAERFDLSISGSICIKLSDGSAAYVSRRCVPKVKKLLGI